MVRGEDHPREESARSRSTSASAFSRPTPRRFQPLWRRATAQPGSPSATSGSTARLSRNRTPLAGSSWCPGPRSGNRPQLQLPLRNNLVMPAACVCMRSQVKLSKLKRCVTFGRFSACPGTRFLGRFCKVRMVAKGLAPKKFASGGAGQPWWRVVSHPPPAVSEPPKPACKPA